MRSLSRSINAVGLDDRALVKHKANFFERMNIRERIAVHRDKVALVPYLLRKDGSPGFITYDDPLSTYTRVIYSDWVQGLGGTFMWSLDEDYDGHSQDLLDAMYQATQLQPLSDDDQQQ